MRMIVSAVAIMLTAGSVQAASVVNGSFENGTNAPGSGFNTLGAGDTSITGWTVGGAGIDWIGTYWQASQGSRSLDLSALSAGSISQDVATVVGRHYRVTFDLAGNPDGSPPVKNLDVTVNGAALASYTFTTNGTTSRPAMGWLTKGYDFVATSTNSNLKFTSLANTPSGPALDNISLAAVPEASTWVMLIAGFGMVGIASRRRRSAVAA